MELEIEADTSYRRIQLEIAAEKEVNLKRLELEAAAKAVTVQLSLRVLIGQ